MLMPALLEGPSTVSIGADCRTKLLNIAAGQSKLFGEINAGNAHSLGRGSAIYQPFNGLTLQGGVSTVDADTSRDVPASISRMASDRDVPSPTVNLATIVAA